MRIISIDNELLVEELNTLLLEQGVNEEFILKELEGRNEVGAILYIPTIFSSDLRYIIYREDYKKSDYAYKEIVKVLNKNLKEAFKSFKKEIKELKSKKIYVFDFNNILNNENRIGYNK